MAGPLAFLPYIAAAYGGYKGYKGAKDAGASGIGRLLGAAGGAYSGYTLGSTGMSMFPGSAATKAFTASQPAFLANMPGAYNPQSSVSGMVDQSGLPPSMRNPNLNAAQQVANQNKGGSLLDIGIYPIFVALSSLGNPDSIEAEAEFFPTGIDSDCHITFHYKNAIAALKSSLKKETKTEAIFYCENGVIKINSRFHEPSSVTLIDNHGTKELKTFDYKTIGYSYEIEHFNQLIRENKTESNIMTFKKSEELISTLDRVRKHIGLVYK